MNNLPFFFLNPSLIALSLMTRGPGWSVGKRFSFHYLKLHCKTHIFYFFPFTNISMLPQYYSYITINLLAIAYTVSLNSSKLVWPPIKLKVFLEPHFLMYPTKFSLPSLNRTLGQFGLYIYFFLWMCLSVCHLSMDPELRGLEASG